MQVQVQDCTPCVPPVYPLHNLCVPLSVCVSRVQGVRKGYTREFYTFVVPVVHHIDGGVLHCNSTPVGGACKHRGTHTHTGVKIPVRISCTKAEKVSQYYNCD